jgi:DNA-binding CsgD family transcriptional regulator
VAGGSALSPLERRVVALRESGLDESAIAVKFRKSPRFIRLVLSIGEMRKDLESASSGGPGSGRRAGMSARQRLVMKWRDRGASYAEIASRLRRSPLYVRRIEQLARRREL